LSDFWPHGAVASKYGVLRSEGYSERAIFVLDRWGIIRYIDIHDIDTQPDNEVIFNVLRRIDPEAARHAQIPQPREPVPLPHGGIVLYCTRWCPSCRRARMWLQEHGLPFSEVDIDVTPGASDQVRQWANGNRTTPTIDVDGTILVEFNEAKLKQALIEKGLLHSA
jgi:glutaredoxin